MALHNVTITKKGVCIDEKPFFLLCGDIHYFRILPGGIRRRLALMKAFGLTAVQTYVPWNLHEPEKGRFVFNRYCDLEGFLQECAAIGLKVLLRPSPYICSEWESGGLPYWIAEDGSVPRTSDPRFLAHVRDYYKELCPRFVPYLATNGGPIIAVAIENEYGSFGNDKRYLKALRDLLTENGVNVPFYTTDGHSVSDLAYGTIEGVWAGVNYRIESAEAIRDLKKVQKDKPPLIGEYWCGRAIHWGEPFARRNSEEVAAGFSEALNCGGLLSFYMFAGGTNFGFMNGANYGVSFSSPKGTPERYIPHTTTYDEDALLNEQGLPTKKYYDCRKALYRFLKKPLPPMPKIENLTQALPPITLDRAKSFWDTVHYEGAVKSARPLAMEDLGQDYGYVLYRTEFTGCGAPLNLSIPALRDRADVYMDRVYIGTLMWDREPLSLPFYVPRGKKVAIEILCENMGRINYGPYLCEKKGIVGGVFVKARHTVQLFGWQNLPLPFRRLEQAAGFQPVKGPVILQGSFEAEPGKDTFLDLRALKKGFVFVNGFNLGRYWAAGPQYTLYVPGELLQTHNTIQVFEQYGISRIKKIKTRKTALLK